MTIGIAIPCLDEAASIGKVIADFRRVIPEAEICVFDNVSEDDTAAIAAAHGGTVVRVKRRGKGHVIQAIFATMRHDICLVVDGDDTYPAEAVHELIGPIRDGKADMVVGTRLERIRAAGMRPLHFFGNKCLTAILNFCFRTRFRDILSGYRAFSREFMQQVPVITTGFEIETELTVQALEKGMAIIEVPIHYKERDAASVSKLRTFHDGYRILMTIAMLLRDHRPLTIFSVAACVFAGLAIAGYVGWGDGVGRGLGIVASVFALLLLGVGLILNAVNTRFRELHVLLRRKG